MNLKGCEGHEYQSPNKFKHLNTEKYVGLGPRRSMDEKISFINENKNLAKKIVKVH